MYDHDRPRTLVALREATEGYARSLNEKRLLRELAEYLRSIVKPMDPYSAKTYCVALDLLLTAPTLVEAVCLTKERWPA